MYSLCQKRCNVHNIIYTRYTFIHWYKQMHMQTFKKTEGMVSQSLISSGIFSILLLYHVLSLMFSMYPSWYLTEYCSHCHHIILHVSGTSRCLSKRCLSSWTRASWTPCWNCLRPMPPCRGSKRSVILYYSRSIKVECATSVRIPHWTCLWLLSLLSMQHLIYHDHYFRQSNLKATAKM